jgi:hypothetical protein
MGVDRPGGMDILTNPDESRMIYLGDSPGPGGVGCSDGKVDSGWTVGAILGQ